MTGSAARSLPPCQNDEAEDGTAGQQQQRRRSPRQTMPSRREHEQQRRRGRAKEQCTDDIRSEPGPRRHRRQRNAHRQQRGEQSQRQVDDENSAPADVLGQIGPEHRSGRARQRKHGGEVAREAAPLARRDVLADQRLRQRHQASTAQSLQRPRRDQRQQRRGQRTRHRRDREDGQGYEQHAAAPEAIAEMAVQRRADRCCQQVGDDHPRQVRQTAERAGDRRQCAGKDGLIGRGEEHRHHHAWKHAQERLAAGQRWRRFGAGGAWGFAVGTHARGNNLDKTTAQRW